MWNQPPAKASLRRLLVLQIALHHDIAAEHDLADGLAVARHLFHGLGIDHGDGFLERVGHALPPLELRALGRRQIVPARLLGADGGGAVDFGQAVDMGQPDADAFGAFEHRDRRRGARDQPDHGLRDLPCRSLGASGALISVL